LPESERASRTFHTIEDVLLAHGFVYPGFGYVAFMHDALVEVSVDDAGVERLVARSENVHRVAAIRANRSATFHIADCDIYSMIYVSIGEELHLPIAMVDLPHGPSALGSVGHNWQSRPRGGQQRRQYGERAGHDVSPVNSGELRRDAAMWTFIAPAWLCALRISAWLRRRRLVRASGARPWRTRSAAASMCARSRPKPNTRSRSAPRRMRAKWVELTHTVSGPIIVSQTERA